MWVLTVFVETYSSVSRIFPRRQVGGQVAQHPDLAFAERLERRLRCGGRRRRRPSGQQAADLGDQGGVRGAVPGLALEQRRAGVQQERQERAVGLGEIERALQGAVGGAGVAERVPGDRRQQVRLNVPGRARPPERSLPGPARAQRSPGSDRLGEPQASRSMRISAFAISRRPRRWPARHARSRPGVPGFRRRLPAPAVDGDGAARRPSSCSAARKAASASASRPRAQLEQPADRSGRSPPSAGSASGPDRALGALDPGLLPPPSRACPSRARLASIT